MNSIDEIIQQYGHHNRWKGVEEVIIKFVCDRCRKVLMLEPRIFEKAYIGHETCLSCRGKEEAK